MLLAHGRHVTTAVAIAMMADAARGARHDQPPPPRPKPVLIPSDGETAPVFHSGDAMDDPAIWVHPTDPRSRC